MSTGPAAGKRIPITPTDLWNILKWMFLLRICLSTAVVLAGALLWREFFGASSTLVLVLFLVFSYLFTAYGWWRLRAWRVDSAGFLSLQLLHDLTFVTVVVLYTEGVSSAFALLYIPISALASILFGMSGGLLVASAASAIYILLGVYQREFASSVAWESAYLPRLSAPEEPFVLNVLILVTLFFLVAVLTAVLRRRLVSVGARVTQLETEIKFITIDTRDILDSIESGVASIDSRGELVFINRKALELLGIEAVTQDPRDIWRALQSRAPALAKLLLDTLDFHPTISRGEVELGSPDGQHVPLGITTNLLYDDRGARRGVTAVFRDISQVKRMEELSRQRDRLAAIAELSASLAHEIKNPLASIRSSVELLTMDGFRSAAADEDRLFQLIVRESDRLSKLLTDFLHFSRMELREEEPIALRELLEEVLELQQLSSAGAREAGRDAATAAGGGPPEVRLDWVGRREPIVEGDFDLLKQLFQNLVVNAVQAVAGKPDGLVTITVSRDYAANAARYGIDPRQYVETRITDNGSGIQAVDLPRIFHPFFTTKPQGNGLGLAIVHRVVNVHGGHIFVESAPGEGAEFLVYLPLSSRTVRRREPEAAAHAV